MFRIRLATEQDSHTIIDFQMKMARETEELNLGQDNLVDGVNAVFRDPQKGKYFVVYNDDQVIASMMITHEWSDWRNKWIWWLQSVYVLPDFRGKGIFRLMYEHVKMLVIKDDDTAGIRLYVDVSNKKAREVYKAVGMDGEHYQTFEWMKE